MKRLLLVTLGAALFGMTVPSPAAHGEELKPAAVDIEELTVGLGGYCKVGEPTPVRVTVRTTEPLQMFLEIQAPDPQGRPVLWPGRVVELAEPGRHQLRGGFTSGRLDGHLVVRLKRGEEILAERELQPAGDASAGPLRPLRQSVHLFATVGEPASFATLDTRSKSRSQEGSGPQVRVVEWETFASLPDEARHLAALDGLVIAERYALSARRSAAIRRWVRGGGHLLVSVGRNASAWQKSRLADWVPVPIAGTTTLRDLSGLESFAAQSQRIENRREPATIAQLKPSEGSVLASSLNGPLLVRAPLGFGRVTVCGFDFNWQPVADWEALPGVCRQLLLGEESSAGEGQQTERRKLAHSGISDLTTQLHAALEHFPEVRRSSLWLVMGLMLLYLMLIGPLDYLLVHRLLGKPRLTWVTFPTMVAIGLGLAVWGARLSNGGQLRANQLDLLDIDAQANRLRARSWMTFYSPETRRYRVAVEAGELTGTAERASSKNSSSDIDTDTDDVPTGSPQTVLNWLGVPEENFGGMYRAGGLQFSQAGYGFDRHREVIDNLPARIWSTQRLTARRAESRSALVDSRLKRAGVGRLSGRLSHRLPSALENWLLAYGNRVYRPANSDPQPALQPGEFFSPASATVSSRELQGYLTGRTATRVQSGSGPGEDILIQQSDYDIRSRDLGRILQMITFHQAAGGSDYTGLQNAALRQGDLSSLLHLDRAVLFGRLKKPAETVRFRLDGTPVEADRHEVFVRIVLPVETADDRQRDVTSLDKS